MPKPFNPSKEDLEWYHRWREENQDDIRDEMDRHYP